MLTPEWWWWSLGREIDDDVFVDIRGGSGEWEEGGSEKLCSHVERGEIIMLPPV